jgi:hypothetical protein
MTSNKVLPVALVAALLGGTVGGFVMHSSNNTTTAPDNTQAVTQPARTTDIAADKTATNDQNALLDSEVAAQTKNMSDEERAAFRDGFMQGVNEACSNGLTSNASRAYAGNNERVVYRTARRTRYTSSAPSRVYYDYGQRSGRSFWQKHRDKLSVAIGTGAGALLGGIIGGKKGAGIGALAGAGGSALYTYKLRRRHRNY